MKLAGLLSIANVLHFAQASAKANWPGFNQLGYLFVFGDSYSTIGFSSKSNAPSSNKPVGVDYPGQTTSGGPNWVDYTTVAYNSTKFMTFDYAVFGHTVSGVQNQINDFLSGAGKKPSYAQWTAGNSVFATWIGINDIINNADAASTLSTLLGYSDNLYNNGARNFLFINIPPFHRAPFANGDEGLGNLITTWNNALNSASDAFQSKHPDASVLVYDSWSLFTKLLNNPSRWGFSDTSSSGGSFWQDVINPKAKVHDYLAQDLVAFLKALPTSPAPQEPGQPSNPTTTVTVTRTTIYVPPTPTPTNPTTTIIITTIYSPVPTNPTTITTITVTSGYPSTTSTYTPPHTTPPPTTTRTTVTITSTITSTYSDPNTTKWTSPGGTPTSTRPTTTTPSPTLPYPTQSQYGQCGGKDYSGPYYCLPPYTCEWQNEYYSQCILKASTTKN